MNVVTEDVLIKVENQGSINLAKNPLNHQSSEHSDIKYFIRSEIQNGNVTLEYVATEDNVADIFTKPAAKIKLQKFKDIILDNQIFTLEISEQEGVLEYVPRYSERPHFCYYDMFQIRMNKKVFSAQLQISFVVSTVCYDTQVMQFRPRYAHSNAVYII